MKKILLFVLVLVIFFSFASAESPGSSVVGMWSFYWDARDLPMSFDVQAYTLYIMEDGTAYMQKATVKNSKDNFSPDLITGVWLGDASNLLINIGNGTHKAWLDDSGRLFFQMTDDMAYIFSRVPLYNYEEGFINE